MSDYDTTIRELTLILLHLTSWTEKRIGPDYPRAWKTFRFEILDELAEAELISDSKRSKSVYLTPEGQKLAKELLAKYGIPDQ